MVQVNFDLNTLYFKGNPAESEDVTSDPYRTLFVARIVSILVFFLLKIFIFLYI